MPAASQPGGVMDVIACLMQYARPPSLPARASCSADS